MLATSLLRNAKKKPRTGWKRASGNPILSAAAAWETQSSVQEPTVLYDAAAGLPLSAKFGMWYTGGFNIPAMGYAYCAADDPTVPANWTKYASNPVLGQGGSGVAGFVSGNNVVKIGTTYYAYYYDAVGGGNLKVSTSADGLAWSAPTTALAKGAVSWMPGGWANCFVWNEGGTTWKMLVEGSTNAAGGQLWATAYATSTDGLTWTVVGTGPLTSLKIGSWNYGGPWLLNGGQKTGGHYQLFYHAGVGNYSQIYHAYSSDAQNWTVTGLELEPNYGTYEAQQAADPAALEVGGIGYLFYDGVDNGGPHAYINVATYPGKVSDLALWLA